MKRYFVKFEGDVWAVYRVETQAVAKIHLEKSFENIMRFIGAAMNDGRGVGIEVVALDPSDFDEALILHGPEDAS